MSFSTDERDLELARNIVEAHGFIHRYLDGMKQSEFLMDSKSQDAVAMRLQQILESSIKLSPAVKKSLSIDWSSLTAMRNKISHHYVDVDAELGQVGLGVAG